jgi:hypothetical protein
LSHKSGVEESSCALLDNDGRDFYLLMTWQTTTKSGLNQKQYEGG